MGFQVLVWYVIRSLLSVSGLFIWLFWHVYLSLGEAHDIAPRETDPQALTDRKHGLHPGKKRCVHVTEGGVGGCGRSDTPARNRMLCV